MTPEQLNQFLYRELPLASALNLRVLVAERKRVVLSAPFGPNRNAHGSAFGGSLAALGILGGWAMVYTRLKLDQLPAALVIKNSDCDYRAPITSDIRIEASLDEPEWQQFLERFSSHGSSRMVVKSLLGSEAGETAAVHSGTYVAMQPGQH